MKNPFVFGHLLKSDSFVNRISDIERLKQNIDNQIHTIIISPRRWGKSSMVNLLEDKIGSSKKTVFCHMDMFNISDESDFFHQFSNEILKSTSSKTSEIVENIKLFLKNLKPEISFGEENSGKITVSLNTESEKTAYKDVLNLSEVIAKKKGIKLVICIDEFQAVSRFGDSLLFQQRLRANWQHHQNVVYILYGSKRSMLSNLFENQDMPFYKFGDLFYLKKIDSKHLNNFIIRSFTKTGKKITGKYASKVTTLMENHSFYVQQFAHILWNNTTTIVDQELFDETVVNIIERNSLLFESIYENLSITQIRVLRMVIEDDSRQYTKADNLLKYKLKSSANVIQAFKALESKEVIDRFEGYPMFLDPVFRLWLMKRIFKIV